MRRICDNCAQPTRPSVQQKSWLSRYLRPEQIDDGKFLEGPGCTYCNMTGYRGRVGIYELLEVDAGLPTRSAATT